MTIRTTPHTSTATGRRARRLVAAAAAAGLAAGIALPGVASAATPEPRAEAGGCSFGVWDTSVQGQPTTLAAGAATGTYLWHDTDGFHLRVTHPSSDGMVFTGTIKSTKRLHDIARVMDESGDYVKLSRNGRTLSWRLGNHGKLDGLDFKVGCAPGIMVNAMAAGSHDPANVFVGATGLHPNTDPFALARHT